MLTGRGSRKKKVVRSNCSRRKPCTAVLREMMLRAMLLSSLAPASALVRFLSVRIRLHLLCTRLEMQVKYSCVLKRFIDIIYCNIEGFAYSKKQQQKKNTSRNMYTHRYQIKSEIYRAINRLAVTRTGSRFLRGY